MDSGTMAENVARFSAAIIRLFPNVWDHLFYIGCYEYAPQRENLVDMIPAICKLSSGVSIIDLSHGIYDQDLLPKSNLRHIMFRSDQYTDAQMELVRRNSQSLECIHLVNIDTAACLKLIQDPIGNPVVYPHVWKLELFVKTKLDAMTFPSPNREQVAEQTIALAFKISATIERIELDVEYTTDYDIYL
ncbi:hypothetical protein EC988_003468 [Linderina pennispora]|nr:hypothetical protein EC988_003468 [Linderina pennispora]